MKLNDIKKALYLERCEANRIGEDMDYLYYITTLLNGTEINFKVPRNEAVNDEGNLIFMEIEPARLLIRYITK